MEVTAAQTQTTYSYVIRSDSERSTYSQAWGGDRKGGPTAVKSESGREREKAESVEMHLEGQPLVSESMKE